MSLLATFMNLALKQERRNKMKAPEKIYIEIDNKAHVYFGLQPENAEEYIRKDALLEWLEGCKNNPVITDLQKGNIQELIDKLNEM